MPNPLFIPEHSVRVQLVSLVVWYLVEIMDSSCCQQSLEGCRSNIFNQRRIFLMGSFIANALEFLPVSKRLMAIREIYQVQELYKSGPERFLGNHTKLNFQLLRLEHFRKNPEFYDDADRKSYEVPSSYSDALMKYVSAIPASERELSLGDICCIISRVISANLQQSGYKFCEYES